MPFLSIFRKDKDAPRSPVSSRHSGSFSRAKSRPSVSSRSGSPPPQLANISPVDLDYVLPELDELEPEPESVKRRGLLRRRRESVEPASPRPIPPRPFSPPRPLSEALLARDPDRDTSNNAINNGINKTNMGSNSNDSDDDPLVPPPPRASVFAGFTYTDKDRSQSLPENSSSTSSDMAKTKKKDGPRPSGGLFGWRSKSSKEVPTAPAPDPDASFSLKSFRHVGPAPEPTSPTPTSPNNTTPPNMTTPPSSFSRATDPSTTPTARPVPGRSAPAARERVNSTSSEGMMPAGLFRQAARRSSTNLVEDAAEPVKPRIRDNEKRGPPTRPWDTRDDSGAASSASERPPRSIRPRPSGADSQTEPGGSRVVSRSSSAIPYVGPRKSMALDDADDSTPESPSPFAGRLGDSGRESPFATRSDYGSRNVTDLSHIPRGEYSTYGARSDGGLRRPGPRPSSPAKLQSSSRPSILSSTSTLSSSPPRLSLGLNSPPSPTSPKRGPPPSRRPNSPTKPRHSAPTTRPTRSPIRTTIPTKTNDGPSIKPGITPRPTRPGSPAKPGRRPSAGETSMRSVSVDVVSVAHARRPSGFEVVSRPKSPGPVSAFGQRSGTIELGGNGSVTDLARPKTPGADYSRPTTPGVDMARPKTPGADYPGAGGEIQRGKSPAPAVNSTRAKSPAPTVSSMRAQAPSRVPAPAGNARPGPAPANTRAPGPAPANTRAPGPAAVPRTGYVPPPRASSLAPTTLVDSDSDESPEETESGSDEFGYGAKKAEGAVRGKVSFAKPDEGLSRERTITQRDRASPVPPADAKPAVSAAPPRIGVSLFDKPMPKFDNEGTKVSTPRAFGRTRASNSTSAISDAAKARNSAAMAEANRAMTSPGKHNRSGSETLRTSHIRAPAVGTDTDEDEEDEEKSDSESDDAPLSSLAPPARRPGSSASTAAPLVTRTPAAPSITRTPAAPSITRTPAPPATRANAPRPSLGPPLSRSAKPLIDMAGVAPPPRPARRVPGVGVTRTSSLKGSRSVEDLGRMIMAKSVVGVGRPGPRPFVVSPPSSTGDSSSGKAPLTPRDGSESGAARRSGSDEARRKERRRSEAKASVDLANVINGPGPVDNDDEDEHMSAHHSQMGHGMGMGMGMGWNGSGFFPQGGFAGFPTSQSMPFLHPQLTGPAPMGFMPPPPPPGANEAYLAAHQQAMMIAKQTYLSAVAQQAMAAATEQWERSSVAGGGSVYGGSQMSMMGMPMMGMYSHSAYAASSYEPSVVGGWGSSSAYGGPARSAYGGPGRTSPTKSAATARNAGHGRTRSRTHTSPSDTPKPPSTRTSPVPPSTWATRGKRM